jgi:hypothetical protein
MTLTCDAASIAADATTQFSVTLNMVTPGSAGITASVTSAQHDPTLPNSSNVTVTITEHRRETGGGSGVAARPRCSRCCCWGCSRAGSARVGMQSGRMKLDMLPRMRFRPSRTVAIQE